MMWLVFMIELMGCALLALTQAHHWRKVTTSPMPAAIKAKLMAILFLSISFFLTLIEQGLGFALPIWLLFFALASFLIAMLLAFKPIAFLVICQLLASGSRSE